ncbi:MAG TPA: beta-ketoacyl reductase, partial [Herpetosiphonaceae bacterium]
ARLSRSEPDAAQLPAATRAMPIAADGSYLITGGLGGLGLTVARWLAEQGAGALVLLGRRAPGAETQAAITTLEQAGTRVFVAQADVTDAAALAAVLEQIRATLPPLRGIVHAAALIDDGLLRQQSWEQFERVMQPKAAGAWTLHLLTRDLPLDFFVCFSSIASVFGSPGQANYAAANAFLDGLAHYRRALGLPATSINWGPWAGSGMEAGNERRRAAQGLGMIEPHAGLQALGWLLRHDATQETVLAVDWQQFLDQIPPGGLRAFAGPLLPVSANRVAPQPTMREQLAALPLRERQPWLTEQVRALIAQVLGAESPEQIGRREGLFEQGLDSLMALEVKNRLEAYSGCGLPQTFVFDYPMVDAIVEYFSRNLFPELFQPSPPAASGAAPIHDLADLSDDEAEALLMAELDRMNR